MPKVFITNPDRNKWLAIGSDVLSEVSHSILTEHATNTDGRDLSLVKKRELKFQVNKFQVAVQKINGDSTEAVDLNTATAARNILVNFASALDEAETMVGDKGKSVLVQWSRDTLAFKVVPVP